MKALLGQAFWIGLCVVMTLVVWYSFMSTIVCTCLLAAALFGFDATATVERAACVQFIFRACFPGFILGLIVIGLHLGRD